MRAHQISDEVEASIQEAFPNAEVIIHEDPDNVPESRARFS
jgi:divalent metal cation (Fe/Co/Zn/Cd) transporter